MQKALYKLMDKFIDGSDIYYHKDSLWIVFTETKEWVIELTDKNTLWYNYRFFSRIFDFVSLDVVENQHYITKWVEDTIQNGVRHTREQGIQAQTLVEDTIQNGVRHTFTSIRKHLGPVEDTIQNGVRHTEWAENHSITLVEDTIQNGVRHTFQHVWPNKTRVEDTIQNGIKETYYDNHHRLREVVLTLKDGTKETKQEPSQRTWMSGVVIENGIRETKTPGDIESTMEFMNENNTLDVPKLIEEVITNTTGVKNNTPQEFFQYVMVNDTIQNGIKYTHENIKVDSDEIEDTINNGIKETYEDVYHHEERIKGVIRNGIKNTYSDEIKGDYDWRDQFKPDDVISNGRKL
jgi:hypothetical protein